MSDLPLPFVERHVYSVSELTRKVKLTVEEEIGRVWVEGEISNFRRLPSSGHCYFTLKDGSAQLAAVLFASSQRGSVTQLVDGMVIRACGDLTVYEARGQYQLVVRTVEPGGLGLLMAQLEALKRRLQAEGLFDAARKRPLPLLPHHVGLVTSPGGAAIRDLITILTRRFPNLRITLAPARVQGAGAAAEIAGAIALLNGLPDPPDVLIVGRGGGSIEDLWAFNEEPLVRAVAASAIPVIAAVGHESDTTLCDFAADLRAPTPSAAAELVVGCKDAFERQLAGDARSLRLALERRLDLLRQRFRAAAATPTLREPGRLTERRAQTLDNLELRLARATATAGRGARQRVERARSRLLVARATVIAPAGERVVRLRRELARAAAHRTQRARVALDGLDRQLRSLGPQAVLERGYSLTRTGDGTLVRHAAQVAPGTMVRTQVASGDFESIVR